MKCDGITEGNEESTNIILKVMDWLSSCIFFLGIFRSLLLLLQGLGRSQAELWNGSWEGLSLAVTRNTILKPPWQEQALAAVSRQKGAIFIPEFLTSSQEGLAFHAAFRLSLPKQRELLWCCLGRWSSSSRKTSLADRIVQCFFVKRNPFSSAFYPPLSCPPKLE